MEQTNPADGLSPWEDANQAPLIRFQSVTKNFGTFTAIDDLSIDIYRQEFFALLGPSGCGKTTLMRMLAGFETPDRGTITLDGQDMASVPPNRRATNMMFQSYALFPHLSVYDNIAFGLKRSPMPTSEIDGRVDEMLRLTRLEKLARRKPHQISGGQRQRVALARSLARAPKLLLLDEPLAALDKKLRQETQFELVDIQEKTGTTFVIVTHDQEEAMTVATRIAVMDAGRIVQVDVPEQLYENPNSLHVAKFIGDMNIIAGKAGTTDSLGTEIHWAEAEVPIVAVAHARISKGTACHFAIRPEKVSISGEIPENCANSIQGVVLDIAYLGNVSTYHVKLRNGLVIKAQTANNHRTNRRSFTWDDPVWLSWTDTAGVILTG